MHPVVLLRYCYLAVSSLGQSGQSPGGNLASNLFGAIHTYPKRCCHDPSRPLSRPVQQSPTAGAGHKDPEASKKLIEMAEEFRLYAERLEQTHYAERLGQTH